MAGSQELPGLTDKRDILFGDNTTDEKMLETGKRFMDAEQYYDALEFFARCSASEQVRHIADIASERGDAALYLRATVVLDEKPDRDILIEIAERAQNNGRLSMARVAYQRAGMDEKAEQITDEILKGEEPGIAPEPDDGMDQDQAP